MAVGVILADGNGSVGLEAAGRLCVSRGVLVTPHSGKALRQNGWVWLTKLSSGTR